MLAPGAAEPRVTLSADVLSKSQMHLLIAGDDKRAALDKALGTEDTFTAPVAAVLRRCEHATVHWAP
jgi:6-phosphogluconolactonase